MADQSATAVYNPSETSADQLVNAFAEAKSSGDSRFTLTARDGGTDSSATDGAGAADTSNDFAPPLPSGSPDFGGENAGSAEPAGGDFDVSLEAPAE